MKKKIVITGASGLIGRHLCHTLSLRGDEVFIFTRDTAKTRSRIPDAKEYIKWDYSKPSEWSEYLNNKDAVIHLAGANLFSKRWNDDYKKKILFSRQLGTRNLVDAIKLVSNKPSVFICSSAVGYYGESGNKKLTEESGAGNDFLAGVCKVWEDEAAQIEKFGVRRISIRTGIVLSAEGGALKEMLTPFKLFIGGPIGKGTQWFPWIHIDDIVRVYIYSLDNSLLSGAINASASNPVTMKEFAHTLGKILNRPSFFRVPQGILRVAVGEGANSITSSLKIIPQKLLESGFRFKFENLEDALKNLLE